MDYSQALDYNRVIKLQKQKAEMIYDGPITDPRHRYYMPTANPTSSIRNNTEISPRSMDRYAKFRAQPVNLGPGNVSNMGRLSSSPQNLSNSNIYTKQGMLRRNQIGWDGVKLTEYVTGQISENYLENQRVLEKFRLQAEQNRRQKKFRHAFENDTYLLPPISPNTQELSRYAPSPSLYNPSTLEQYEIIQQIPHYRNVGVNTHKVYEKNQLQKYANLMSKYQNLKEKYKREKQLRRKEKRKYQEQEERKERERESIEKIKDIEQELMNISVKLQASNQFLSEKLAEDSRRKQAMEEEKSRLKVQNTARKFRTEPDIEQNNEKSWQIPQPQLSIVIPENPLQKLKRNLTKKPHESPQTPTVVYSRTNDFNNSKYLTKFKR